MKVFIHLLLIFFINIIYFIFILLDINWNAVETILNYGMESVLLGSSSPTEIPLLLAENYFHTPERKEKVYLFYLFYN